jgi:hypothetical protein
VEEVQPVVALAAAVVIQPAVALAAAVVVQPAVALAVAAVVRLAEERHNGVASIRHA